MSDDLSLEDHTPMPYEPEKNAGIDVQFSLNAPAGQFRVIGVDTFDGTDWIAGDFD